MGNRKLSASMWLSAYPGSDSADILVELTGTLNPGRPPASDLSDPGERPFVEDVAAWDKDGKSVWLSEADEKRAEEALMDEAGLDTPYYLSCKRRGLAD